MSAPVIPKRRLWFDRLGPYAVPTSPRKNFLTSFPPTNPPSTSSSHTRHDCNCPLNCYPPSSVMALSAASGSMLRVCARQQLPTTSRAAIASCQQQRGVASSFDSPFGPASKESTYKIPDFSKYQSKKSPRSNQVFSYFMAGTMGLASAVGAKATVQGRFDIILRNRALRILEELGIRLGWRNISLVGCRTAEKADCDSYRLLGEHVRLR